MARKRKKDEEEKVVKAEEPKQPEAPKEPEQPAPASQPKKKIEMPDAAKRDQERGLKRTQTEYARATDYKIAEAGEMTLPAYQEPRRAALEEKNKAGKLGGISSTFGYAVNKYDVNVDSIKDTKHLAWFVKSLHEDKDRVKVAEAWATNKGIDAQDVLYQIENTSMGGLKAFDRPQSANGKLKASGLYDYNGNEVDPSTANSAVVLQAIRMNPDKESREDALYAYASKYGYIDFDTVDFQDSADLTQSGWNKAVKEFEVAFSLSDGRTQANDEAYADMLDRITSGDLDIDGVNSMNPRVQKQLIAKLDAEYRARTNAAPPTEQERRQEEEARAAEAVAGDEPGLLEGIGNWFKNEFAAPVREAGKAGEATGSAAEPEAEQTAQTASSYGAAAQNEAVAQAAPKGEVQGPQQQTSNVPTFKDWVNLGMPGYEVPQGEDPLKEAQGPRQEQDAASFEAFQAWMEAGAPGYTAKEEPAEAPQKFQGPMPQYAAPEAVEQGLQKYQGPMPQNQPINLAATEAAVENGEPGFIRGEYAGPMQMFQPAQIEQPQASEFEKSMTVPYDPQMTDEQALSFYERGMTLDERNLEQIMWAVQDKNVYGVVFGEYEDDTNYELVSKAVPVEFAYYGSAIGEAANIARSLPKDIGNSARLTLGRVVQAIDGMGYMPPNGENLYDYALAMPENKELLAQVNGVIGAQKQVNEAYAEAALEEKEAYANLLEGDRKAILAGTATPEAAARLAQEYGDSDVDIWEDETFAMYKFQMSSRSAFYEDGGTFWSGDSAAAQEGRNLLNLGGKGGTTYSEYKYELMREVEGVLESYTRTAHSIGVDLDTYLSSSNIGGLNQVINIAYNKMIADGRATAEDIEAQTAVDTLNTTSVGKVKASGLGIQSGAASRAESTLQTVEMGMDAATRTLVQGELTTNYYDKYGAAAPQMYMADLVDYMESGELSEQTVADLQDKIRRCENIFELAYEIDPGYFKGAVRLGREECGKTVEELQEVAQTLPADERMLFNGFSSFTDSILGMGEAVIVGGVANAIVPGSGLVLGSAVAWGVPSYADSYDAYRNKGVSPEMAGRMAFARAAATTAINMGGTGSQMDLWFGNTPYQILKKAANGGKSGRELVKFVARHGHQEGMEEVGEVFVDNLFELADDEVKALDAGASFSLSRTLSSMTKNLYETDVVALGKEAFASYGMGAVMGGVFTTAGVAKTAASVRKGAAFKANYESVNLAEQMADGNLPFTDENIGKFISAMNKDLEDAKFRRWIDSNNVAAIDQSMTITAMMRGAGNDARLNALAEAAAARGYKAKYDTALEAGKASAKRWFELRTRVSNGETALIADMESARNQMGKDATAVREAREASEKSSERARNSMTEWLTECRKDGRRIRSMELKRHAEKVANARLEYAMLLSERYERDEALRVAQEERKDLVRNAVGTGLGDGRAEVPVRLTPGEADAWNAEAEAWREEDAQIVSDMYEEASGAETAVNAEAVSEAASRFDAMDDAELDAEVDSILADRESVAEDWADTEAGEATEQIADTDRRKEEMLSYLRERLNRAIYNTRELLRLGDRDGYIEYAAESTRLYERIRALIEGKRQEKPAPQEAPETISEGRMYAEAAVFGDGEAEAETASEPAAPRSEFDGMTDDQIDAEIKALDKADADAIATAESIDAEREAMGWDDDLVAEMKEEAAAPSRDRRAALVEYEIARLNDLDQRMMQLSEYGAFEDDVADSMYAEVERVNAQLEALGADVEEITYNRFGTTREEAERQRRAAEQAEALANAEAEAEAEATELDRVTESLAQQIDKTSAEAEMLAPARTELGKKIYVPESLRSDLLLALGCRTLTEANSRYGLKLTKKKGVGAKTLNEEWFAELETEAQGVVKAQPDDMSAEFARLAEANRRNKEEQKANKAAAADIRKRRAEADERRKARVQEITGKNRASNIDALDVSGVAQETNAEGAVKVEPESVEARAETNVDAATQSNQQQTPGKPSRKARKAEESALKSLQKLARDLKIGMRVKSNKRFNSADARMSRGVLGYYKGGQRNAIVRSKEAGKLNVAGHEIGHGVQEQLGISSTPQMITSWQRTFGNTGAYSPQQYDHEAFAEFFWRYLQDRNLAVQYAGDAFVDTFERAMKQKGIYKPVQRAAQKVSAYMYASVDEKIRARMVDASDAGKPSSISELVSSAENKAIDDTAVADEFGNIIRAATGEKVLSLEDNLRDTVRFNRRAGDRAAHCLSTALVDPKGNVIYKSLAQAFEDGGLDGKDFDLFWEYMLAKHSLDRDTVKKEANQVFDEESISTADRKDFVARMEREHPEFVKANQEFQAWRRVFMQTYLVDNGFLGEDGQTILDALDAAYKNYVPTYRAKTGWKGKMATVGGRTYKMRTATGSTEDVINPFDSFVSMVNSITAMVADNDSRKKFAELYDRFSTPRPGETGAGVGLFANEITQDMRRVEVSTKGMLKKVTKILTDINTDPNVILKIGDIIGTSKVEYQGTGKVDMNNVITVRNEDGSVRYFEIYNPEFFSLLSGVTGNGEKGLLDLAARGTRIMSMLTTGSNPVFGITNALRDFQNSVNYGTWATNYATGAFKWIGALWDVVTKGEASQEYEALGGGGWSQYDTKSKKGADRVRSDVFRGYNRSTVGRTAKSVARGLFRVATMEDVNAVIEKTSRVAEYKYGKHDRTTAEGRIEAFLASQDVTTDFARRGSSRLTRELKACIPFFNASLQGIYRNARQFTAQESGRAKQRFVKNVFNTALTSMLAHMLLQSFMDDEEKEEFALLDDEIKVKHMFLPNFAPDAFGESPLIRIPLDQNPVSYVVNTAVTQFMWDGKTDNEFVVEMSALANVLLDNIIPLNSTIFDPILAINSNKNWYGSDIVPSYLEDYHETNQYTEDTPSAFVAISDGLSKLPFGGINISPMMLQYMAEQYTGYFGQTIIPALPTESEDMNAAGVLTGMLDSLVATTRKRLTTDPLKYNKVVSGVYDSYDMMAQIYKPGRSKRLFEVPYLRANLTDREFEDAVNEAYAFNRSGGALYEAKKELGELYDQLDEIEMREDLTDEQKYTLSSEVRREMIDVSLDAQESVQDYSARYMDNGTFPKLIRQMFLGYGSKEDEQK